LPPVPLLESRTAKYLGVDSHILHPTVGVVCAASTASLTEVVVPRCIHVPQHLHRYLLPLPTPPLRHSLRQPLAMVVQPSLRYSLHPQQLLSYHHLPSLPPKPSPLMHIQTLASGLTCPLSSQINGSENRSWKRSGGSQSLRRSFTQHRSSTPSLCTLGQRSQSPLPSRISKKAHLPGHIFPCLLPFSHPYPLLDLRHMSSFIASRLELGLPFAKAMLLNYRKVPGFSKSWPRSRLCRLRQPFRSGGYICPPSPLQPCGRTSRASRKVPEQKQGEGKVDRNH